MADETLPTWPEIKAHAVSHLHAARNEMSGAADWLRSIDSPPTPGQARSARKARKLTAQIKDLIDEAKDALNG